MNYDPYHARLKSVFDEYDRKLKSIDPNNELNERGKQLTRDRLINERNDKIQKIVSDANDAYSKRKDGLTGQFNKRPDPIEKAREKMLHSAIRDINLGDGDIRDDDVRTTILDNNITGLRKDIKNLHNFMKAQSYSRKSADWFRREIMKAGENGDIDRLEFLHESASLKVDPDSEQLVGVISPLITRAKENAKTPQERKNESDLEDLEKQRTLFQYNVDSVLKRNEYADVRNAGKEAPVTDIRLSTSHPARAFQQYKS